MNSASILTVTCDLWHETREHVGSMAACRTHQARIVAISLIYPLHPHRSYISVQLPVSDVTWVMYVSETLIKDC